MTYELRLTVLKINREWALRRPYFMNELRELQTIY